MNETYNKLIEACRVVVASYTEANKAYCDEIKWGEFIGVQPIVDVLVEIEKKKDAR